MNTARNLLPTYITSTPTEIGIAAPGSIPEVSADMPVVDLLPRLLDSPSHTLSVSDGEREIGVVTETLLLEGLAREFSRRDDCSIITVSCAPEDYAASRVATAVEDAGVHLLDLWTGSTPDGQTSVTIRVRCDDPSTVVHSMERYGFETLSVYSPSFSDAEKAMERFLALQAYLNV